MVGSREILCQQISNIILTGGYAGGIGGYTKYNDRNK
jgi:hypothetical protein